MTLVLVSLATIFIAEIAFFPGFTPVPNVSAVSSTGNVEVYWDENCSLKADSIDWGILSPGEVKKAVVYVRNEGNESFLLILTPQNWNPQNASDYLNLSWGWEEVVEAGEVVKVTLSLVVSPRITGIYNFSFDIVFQGAFGDVNIDNWVNVFDFIIVRTNLGSTQEDREWNPLADLNKDGIIDVHDIALILHYYS